MSHGVMFEGRRRHSNHLSPSEDQQHQQHPAHVQHVGQNLATKAMSANGRLHPSLVLILTTTFNAECTKKLESFTRKLLFSYL